MNAENLRTGWVRIYRSLIDHALFTQHPPEYLKIWVYFLCRAAFQARRWWDGREEVEIPMGGFVSSINAISDACGVSRGQAERAIQTFRKCAMITLKPGHHHTLYVIVNFEDYQRCQDQTETQTRRKQDTDAPESGHRQDADKTLPRSYNKEESKKEEKEHSRAIVDSNGWDPQIAFEELAAAYPQHRSSRAHLAQQNYIAATGGLEEKHHRLLKLLGLCKDSEDWTKDDGQYVPGMAKWLSEPPWHLLKAHESAPKKRKPMVEMTVKELEAAGLLPWQQ